MTQRGTGDTTMSRARQASRDPCTPHNEIARGRAFVLGASVRKRHFPNAARALYWIRDGRAPPRDRMRLRLGVAGARGAGQGRGHCHPGGIRRLGGVWWAVLLFLRR